MRTEQIDISPVFMTPDFNFLLHALSTDRTLTPIHADHVVSGIGRARRPGSGSD